MILAMGGDLSNEQVVGRGAVLLNPHLVSEEMVEEVVHGQGLESSGHRGDEGVVFGTQTGKKIKGELVFVQRLLVAARVEKICLFC
jgi:hypothetical protein